MAEGDSVERVIAELTAAKANTSCEDMSRHLESLGFQIRDGRKPGHKVYVHDGLREFYSAGYTCGHGKNPTILPVYVGKVLSVLKQHKSEILSYLGENDER